jgi:hypothetical protein
MPAGWSGVSNERSFAMMTEQEEWRDIPGFEGYYAVSNLGRVKSLERVVPHSLKGKKTIRSKILNPSPRYGGYSAVVLYKDGLAKSFRVHTLVMLAFVGPRPKGQCAMHLCNVASGLDNSLANLRYGSPTCNQAFKVDDGTHNIGSRHPAAKLTEKSVSEIKKLLGEGVYRHLEIGKMFSVSRQTISGINQGRVWAHV